jgi:hypothetical protein
MRAAGFIWPEHGHPGRSAMNIDFHSQPNKGLVALP